MIDKIKIRKIFLLLGFIFIAQLISFLLYFLPNLNNLFFIFLFLIFFGITYFKFEYGFLILATEVLINSKGYLFFFEFNNFKLSIRIALWILILFFTFSHLTIKWYRQKKISFQFSRSKFFSYFIALVFFILVGLINGFLNKNSLHNIFFDFNSWLFFLLLIPLYEINFNKDILNNGLNLILAGLVWLALKTFLLIFIFSHNLYFSESLYRWIRLTGEGEITQMEGGLSRIFFQAQIFILTALFVFLIQEINHKKEINLKIKNWCNWNIFFIVIFLASLIISFSRSFWASLILNSIILFFYFGFKKNLRQIIYLFFSFIIYLILSLILIFGIIKFPLSIQSNINATESFSQRILNSKESAIASRWELLNPLWQEVKNYFWFGKGFGSTITYSSKDPRVLQNNPNGRYTTYAFEWGFLDLWLKIGLFGLIAYITLLIKIFFSLFKLKNNLSYGLALGLIALIIVNFFTPYLNHPLGIAYILFIVKFSEYNN